MTEEEYSDFIYELNTHEYTCINIEDCDILNYYKILEYRQDKNGYKRALCKLSFNIYHIIDPKNTKHQIYSYKPIIHIYQNSGKLIDISLYRLKRTINEYEEIAKEFLKIVNILLKNE